MKKSRTKSNIKSTFFLVITLMFFCNVPIKVLAFNDYKAACIARGGMWTDRSDSCSKAPTATETDCIDRKNGSWQKGGISGNQVTYTCVTTGSPKSADECQVIGGVWSNGGSPTAANTCSKGYGTDAVAGGSQPIQETPGGFDPVDKRQDCNGTKIDETNCGIVKYVNLAFSVVSGLVLLGVIGNIIVSGIMYSMSQGDSGAAAKARSRIQQAVVALIMYFSLYAFIQWLIPGGVF